MVASETNPDDGVYLQYRRSVVVRLLSSGPKFRTREGYFRDQREHDSDLFGIEYEVEIVEINNEPARLWLIGENKCLQGFKVGDVVAIGWKTDQKPFGAPGSDRSKTLTVISNTAWRVEECCTQ